MNGSDEWNFYNTTWNIEDAPDVYEFIKGTKTGSIITVKGQITDVGKIMSYNGEAHGIY